MSDMSDQFLVSARKYRPVSFETMVGQDHITETLVNEIKQNRLAQAFLFTGPRGVGKTTCARILARVINTASDSSIDPNYDFAFNIFELDAASNNSVDDIRQLVEQVRIPPQVGKYKVYIIDEVHMLSSNAFNAFLKTLEEPPPYAIFILATTERHKILPTILSRCQIFNFKRIEPQGIVEQLKIICQNEGIEAEEHALHVIAMKADGGMRDALSMFDQTVSYSKDKKITYAGIIENLNVLDHNYYFEITRSLFDGDYGNVLLKFDEVLANGFDGQYFLNGLAAHFRDLLVVKNINTAKLISASEHMLPQYKSQADSTHPGFLLNAIQIADHFDQTYKASRNQRLHVELALIKMAHINAAISLAEELKKKSPELSSNTPVQTQGKDATPKPAPDTASKVPQTMRLGNLSQLKNAAPVAEAPPVNKEADVADGINKQPEVKTEISDAHLKQLVHEFAELKKQEGRPFYHTLLKNLLVSHDDKTVYITLTNNRDSNGFAEVKTELLSYINSQTGHSFSLEVKIEKIQQQHITVYTNRDKFKYLVDKNPFLLTFAKELDLEIE